jgi:hypothetical protein
VIEKAGIYVLHASCKKEGRRGEEKHGKTSMSEADNIVRDLLTYLAAHHQAQDTLEGIAHWWLLEQEVTRRITEVQAALEGLVKDGFVVECRGEDGRTRYKINQEKQEEMQVYLKRQVEIGE